MARKAEYLPETLRVRSALLRIVAASEMDPYGREERPCALSDEAVAIEVGPGRVCRIRLRCEVSGAQ